MAQRVPVLVHRRNHLHRRDVQERREKRLSRRGLALEDRLGLFNSSLDGNVRRAIDFHEGEKINEKVLRLSIVRL